MKPKTNRQVGILGYGRFGKTLADLLASEFEVSVYDTNLSTPPPTVIFTDLNTLLSRPTIFIAVPINEFSNTIKNIAPKLLSSSTVIDVCSVKVYPVNIMEQYLPSPIGIIATHPLFGPDSIREDHSLRMMMYPTRDSHQCFLFWKNYFSQKNIQVLEMTPDEHDRLAAKSQSITHFIGHCLQTINATSTSIDTNGFKKLLAVMEQTCNDSFTLFTDLIRFNPYSESVINQFVKAAQDLQQVLND